MLFLKLLEVTVKNYLGRLVKFAQKKKEKEKEKAHPSIDGLTWPFISPFFSPSRWQQIGYGTDFHQKLD